MTVLFDDDLSDEELEAVALAEADGNPWEGYEPAPLPENTLDAQEFADAVHAMSEEDITQGLGDIDPSLTSDQLSVVKNLNGPIIVVAGPGAGKTKTLVERTVNTIREGAWPSELLIVTFTRKAAAEVRERLEAAIGEDRARAATVSTFHGLAGRILRSDGHRVGLKPTYETLSGSEQKTLVKNLVKQYRLATDVDYLNLISSVKRNAELTSTAQRIRQLHDDGQDDAAALFEAYEAEKKRLDRLDYDDMILLAHTLLNMPEVLEVWGRKFTHVMVDEYQDTDRLQHSIVRLLASNAQSLLAVGDIDQSIYSWRGSDPTLFANFSEDFPNVQVMYLNDNFRSTPEILNVVRHTISSLEVPFRSSLQPNNPAGERPRIALPQDQAAEAQLVTQWIMELLGKNVPFSEIAVLYRGRRQNLQLQLALNRAKIPVKVSGAVGFYEGKTVKDLLAWFRLAVKPDEMSFLRVVDQMPGLGPKAAQELLEAANTEQDGDIVGYLQTHVDNMLAIGKGKLKKVQAVESIVDRLNGLRDVLDTQGIKAALEHALRCIPGETLVRDEVSESDLDDIREVLLADAVLFEPAEPLPVDAANLVHHYAYGSGVMSDPDDETGEVTVQFASLPDTHPGIKFSTTVRDEEGAERTSVAAQVLAADDESPLPPPVEFLQQVSLDNQALAEEAGGAIELSTIHAAKGREWDHVAIIGLVDGLFPGGRGEEGELVQPSDEERRVMFVAESRARKSLLLTAFRAQKLRNGDTWFRKPSVFLYDLEESGLCSLDRKLPPKPARKRNTHWGSGGLGNW